MGAGISDVINVKARVRIKSSGVSPVKDIASIVALGIRIGIRIRKNREFLLGRRESSILLEILLIPAVLMRPSQSIRVCLVKIEQVRPVLDIGEDDSLLLKSAITDNGIIDGYAAELVVIVIVGRDESIGNIRDVVACIGLSSDVGGGALELKGVDEVLPEADELLAELYFVGDVGLALAVAYTDRLFDPDNVGASAVSRAMVKANRGTYRLVQL